MKDYCLSYYCENGAETTGWSVVAEACVCFEDAIWEDANVQLEEYDSLFNTTLSTNSKGSELHSLRRYDMSVTESNYLGILTPD